MLDIPAVSPSAVPIKHEACFLNEEYKIIEITTYHRGKTNCSLEDRTFVRAILDSTKQEIKLKWSENWTEIAPGIETRRENRSTHTEIGHRTHEIKVTGSLRIHRHVCPVYVQYVEVYEYVDYDGMHSSSDSREYWVCYHTQ